MSKGKQTKDELSENCLPPALSNESQENRMISLAMRAAEKQLRDGTASSQVITHFLKLATVKEQVELEKTRAELELMRAKKQAIETGEEIGKLYSEAIEAMKLYSGSGEDNDYENIF